ncbi:hypothetical protein [Dactylosporangium sp. NPDC000521]|uniref:hypothetical protein n=1 Tax=Dactylosporangium sp. NPDC000521 TaxID=3363975 RepID=UPI0036BC0034
MTPEGVVEVRQRYEAGTGMLITELRTSAGLLRRADALTLRSGARRSGRRPRPGGGG